MGRFDFAKIRIDGLPIEAVLADGIEVICPVEQIVELSAEGKHFAFAKQRYAFLNGEVHVDVVRTDEGIASRISGACLARRGLQEVGQECGRLRI